MFSAGRLSRRGFIAAAGAVSLAAGLPIRPAWGSSRSAARLVVVRRIIEIDNKPASVFRIDGAPEFAPTRASGFRATLENATKEETLIHWHGLTPPTEQDGVPGLSQPALAPGGRYEYAFPIKQQGTFWMHSHVGLQEQELHAAPLIIRGPGDLAADEQEVVILLHDFTFKDPQEILADLLANRVNPIGSGKAAMSGGMPHGGRNGMKMDLNDLEFDAFLANDRTLADPEIVRVERGGRVRLRIINAAAASNFWIDCAGITCELIAVDGVPVEPVKGKKFELAVAQRIDLRFRLPKGRGAYPVLAQREGDTPRTGLTLATAGATVRKLEQKAKKESPPVLLKLERQLRATAPLAKRAADRTLTLDLTGSMQPYAWSLNGNRFGEHAPLMVAEGERVEIVMRNRTEMSHPMHLHGHHFQVVAIDSKRFAGAVRDTVLVPPAEDVTIAFDADNRGRWAFHCHNLYHMEAGMMTSVEYEA